MKLQPDLEQVRRAREVLRSVAVRTPLVGAPQPGEMPVYLKPEVLQPTASFKIRGVYNAVAQLSPERRQAGVMTVSAGNTARALAWAARRFGVRARSLMPETAPRAKIEALRALGGEPVLVPGEALFRFLRERGWEKEPDAFVHPWTDAALIAGHGTLALEILEDLPTVEAVFVPVGGGGLMQGVGGVLRQLRPGVRLVGVEPEGCAALAASLEAGRPVEVPCRTICDGVAVPYVAEEVFPALQALVDEVVLVSEREVERAVRQLALEWKLVAEPAGALAYAAALRTLPDRAPAPAVCLVTGGNVEPALLSSCLGGEGPGGVAT